MGYLGHGVAFGLGWLCGSPGGRRRLRELCVTVTGAARRRPDATADVPPVVPVTRPTALPTAPPFHRVPGRPSRWQD